MNKIKLNNVSLIIIIVNIITLISNVIKNKKEVKLTTRRRIFTILCALALAGNAFIELETDFKPLDDEGDEDVI